MGRSTSADDHRRTRRWRTWLAGPVVAGLVVVGGCGSGGGEDEAVPAPGVTRFAEGELSNIPLPFGATPIGPRSEDEGVVTRTYGVEQQQPADVVRRMESELPASGWTTAQPFEDEGRAVWRGEFQRDGQRLEVTVAPTPSIGENPVDAAADGAQISLVLHPDTTGVDAYTDVPATTPEEDDET